MVLKICFDILLFLYIYKKLLFIFISLYFFPLYILNDMIRNDMEILYHHQNINDLKNIYFHFFVNVF